MGKFLYIKKLFLYIHHFIEPKKDHGSQIKTRNSPYKWPDPKLCWLSTMTIEGHCTLYSMYSVHCNISSLYFIRFTYCQIFNGPFQVNSFIKRMHDLIFLTTHRLCVFNMKKINSWWLSSPWITYIKFLLDSFK